MIRKTEHLLKRLVGSGSGSHVERVRIQTWWLLCFPIYRSEVIEASNL
jgi:hypothetical protein